MNLDLKTKESCMKRNITCLRSFSFGNILLKQLIISWCSSDEIENESQGRNFIIISTGMLHKNSQTRSACSLNEYLSISKGKTCTTINYQPQLTFSRKYHVVMGFEERAQKCCNFMQTFTNNLLVRQIHEISHYRISLSDKSEPPSNNSSQNLASTLICKRFLPKHY